MPLPHPKLRYAKANKGGRPFKSGGELSSSDKARKDRQQKQPFHSHPLEPRGWVKRVLHHG
jgi:hypothetical protein